MEYPWIDAGKISSEMHQIVVVVSHFASSLQPVRLLMEFLDVQYNERLYDVKSRSDGSWDRSDWTEEKSQLGLDFPNLPYLIDDETGVKLVQSDASGTIKHAR